MDRARGQPPDESGSPSEEPTAAPGRAIGATDVDAGTAPRPLIRYLVIGGAAVVVLAAVGLVAMTLRRLGAKLGTVRWVAASGRWGAVTAGDESLAPAADGFQNATYRSHSPYCRTLAPHGAGVIYRNAAGAVIGGDFQCSTGDDCRPGTPW